MRLSYTLLFVMAYSLLTRAAHCDPAADALWREVTAKTKAVKTLAATLSLSSRAENGNTNTDTGKILLQKPNLARIDLMIAMYNNFSTVSSDGKRVWQITDDPDPIKTEGETPYVFREVPADPQGRNIRLTWAFPIPYFFNPDQSPLALLAEFFAVDKAAELRYVGKETIKGNVYDVLEQPVVQPHPYTMRLYIGADRLLRRIVVEMPKEGNPNNGYYSAAELSDVVVDKAIAPAAFAYTLPRDARPYVAMPQSASVLSVGNVAPDFTMHLLNGKTQTLAQALAGKKAVYLDFWFTECLSCRHEFPHLQTLYAALQNQGFDVIALDCGDEPDTVRKAMRTLDFLKPATFTVAMTGTDKAGRAITKKYGVDGYPTGCLIDPTGKVRYVAYGFDEKQGLDTLKNALRRMGFKP